MAWGCIQIGIMKYEEHCADCVTYLGEPFGYVHKWMDELFHHQRYGIHHRRVRHHKAGIEEVRAKWGDRAAQAAYRHIVADLRLDGCWSEEMGIPANEEQYKAWGLF